MCPCVMSSYPSSTWSLSAGQYAWMALLLNVKNLCNIKMVLCLKSSLKLIMVPPANKNSDKERGTLPLLIAVQKKLGLLVDVPALPSLLTFSRFSKFSATTSTAGKCGNLSHFISKGSKYWCASQRISHANIFETYCYLRLDTFFSEADRDGKPKLCEVCKSASRRHISERPFHIRADGFFEALQQWCRQIHTRTRNAGPHSGSLSEGFD
ncbi:hypothetical protein KP509_36G059700 [Ceratopteris richardii]|uniref:Uncharacterized protein n=1 Tax=Ceratopteris richardii TaxID=49495 RepID=A0A8T2QC43_CERRI|nr:hypothetical protein KP509_36G059700 [Ceratopteris richardii]